MTLWQALWVFAGMLGILVAAAHSVVGERQVFGPLKSGADPGAALRHMKYRRLFWVFWHFPSLVWALLGALAVVAGLYQWPVNPLQYLAIAIFALSGAVNLWANRTLHIGWVLLFATSALLLAGVFLHD